MSTLTSPAASQKTEHSSMLSMAVLLFSAILSPICFYFFTQQNEINSSLLGTISWFIVLCLSLPNLFLLSNILGKKNLSQQVNWFSISYWSVLTALLIVVVSTSVNLWQNLLHGQTIDLVNHFLTLLFSLLLSSALHMHLLRFRKLDDELSISERIHRLFQGPSLIITLIIALIIVNTTLIFFYTTESGFFHIIATKFLTRGIIPPLTLLLFFWGLILIIGKWITIYIDLIKYNAHELRVLYKESNTQHAKEKLINLCWQQLDSFYAVPKYINWAIPILGFIGTVLGISLATEGLSELLATSESNYSQLLSEALSPLGIAFDTTLIALTLSVSLTLIQTLISRWEEKLLSQFEQNPSI